MEWYLKCLLRHYADFNGRARRTELWMFILCNFIAGAVLRFIYPPLAIIYSLAVFVPTLAVGARRMHDIGKSGWWQLVYFIPVIGWIVLLILFCTEGKEGINEYGINPKELPTKEDQLV